MSTSTAPPLTPGWEPDLTDADSPYPRRRRLGGRGRAAPALPLNVLTINTDIERNPS